MSKKVIDLCDLEENQQLLKSLEKQEKQLLTEFMNSDVCQYPDLGFQLQSAIRDIKRQKLEVCEVINQLIERDKS